MREVCRQIAQAADTDVPVLLQGETGTGKDLVAAVIHRESGRRNGPFIPVNLGALPGDLVGSELFGHEKGAFTGAVERREGKFEQGHQGTVFLDEIGNIDEKMQVSLLRLIEQKKFHRLGGRRLITVDVRLIAATNEEIVELVRHGQFREDLFYRLDVFRIVLPPVRKRHGDIALLVEEFLRRYKRSFEKDISGISPDCLQLLESYDWPGNVREMKNVVQRAVLVCEEEFVLPEHLPPRFRRDDAGSPLVSFQVGTPLNQVEREMIVRTLSATENNRKRAAELLGISRRSLYNKLRRYDIS
jgi:transcriptional regulator with PAS, ATPase and Fis domain